MNLRWLQLDPKGSGLRHRRRRGRGRGRGRPTLGETATDTETDTDTVTDTGTHPPRCQQPWHFSSSLFDEIPHSAFDTESLFGAAGGEAGQTQIWTNGDTTRRKTLTPTKYLCALSSISKRVQSVL